MRRESICVALRVVLSSVACSTASREVSTEKPYAGFIGTRYEVITDRLSAYGLNESLQKTTVSYISIIT